ncbi:MAG TPA: DUF1559 domain-containing protein [Gemmataceae bacterium]|jgi:type II secretory pathway pseudopilin PulG
MIRFICECGQQLQAREENAGTAVLCPACQRQLIVPAVSPASTAVQPEEPAAQPSAEPRIQKDRPALPNEKELAAEEEMEDRPLQTAGNSGKATASLVLGILSVFCNVLTGLPGLIVGLLALRDIKRSQGRLGGHGLALAGVITACAGTLLSCAIFAPALLIGMLLPAVQKVREAAERTQSQNNLKQMGLAMHNYNATNMRLPPAGVGDPNKPPEAQKPLLSWRVAILPFIEQQLLYQQFKLDEPWDSPNNIKLLDQMPRTYMLPGDNTTPPGHTHYQVFVGNGAAFDKTRGNIIPRDFPDGTSNTILIVEAEKAVPWTKPEDIDFDPSKSMMPLMSRRFRNVFHVGLVDGSVRAVTPALSETTFKAAITRKGGEILGSDW